MLSEGGQANPTLALATSRSKPWSPPATSACAAITQAFGRLTRTSVVRATPMRSPTPLRGAAPMWRSASERARPCAGRRLAIEGRCATLDGAERGAAADTALLSPPPARRLPATSSLPHRLRFHQNRFLGRAAPPPEPSSPLPPPAKLAPGPGAAPRLTEPVLVLRSCGHAPTPIIPSTASPAQAGA